LRRDPLPAEGGVKAEGCARLFPFRAEGQSEANARSATEGMVLCPATPSPRDFVATPFVPKGVKAEGCARLFPFAPKGGAKRTRAARPRGWFFVPQRHPPATSSRPPSCRRG